MPEQEPQQKQKPDIHNYIGKLGYLGVKGEEMVAVPITGEALGLFTLFDESRDTFIAPGQGTHIIIQSIECFVGKYSPHYKARPSPHLVGLFKSGDQISFVARDTYKDADGSNGRSHHDVVDATLPSGVQAVIDVNLFACVTRAVEPLLWEGDQA